MEEFVPAYFSGTTNALKKGVMKMTADAAIKKIEGWEEALQEVEIPGARAILRDLGALKRQLDQDEPDGDRIRTILSRLADATIKISDKVEDRNAEKIRDLGQALESASEEDEEEEEMVSRSSQESRRSSSSQRASSSGSSSRRYRDEDEEDHRGPSGRVRDPEHDHRLRGHETERLYESRHRGDDGRGRVTDPEHDHRLSGHETDRLYESRHMERGYDGRGRVTDPEDDHRLRGHETDRLYESRHRREATMDAVV